MDYYSGGGVGLWRTSDSGWVELSVGPGDDLDGRRYDFHLFDGDAPLRAGTVVDRRHFWVRFGRNLLAQGEQRDSVLVTTVPRSIRTTGITDALASFRVQVLDSTLNEPKTGPIVTPVGRHGFYGIDRDEEVIRQSMIIAVARVVDMRTNRTRPLDVPSSTGGTVLELVTLETWKGHPVGDSLDVQLPGPMISDTSWVWPMPPYNRATPIRIGDSLVVYLEREEHGSFAGPFTFEPDAGYGFYVRGLVITSRVRGMPMNTFRARTKRFIALQTTPYSGEIMGWLRDHGTEAPLVDAVVSVGDLSTTTDSTGWFAIAPVPFGHQELLIQGLDRRKHRALIPVNDEFVDTIVVRIPNAHETR